MVSSPPRTKSPRLFGSDVFQLHKAGDDEYNDRLPFDHESNRTWGKLPRTPAAGSTSLVSLPKREEKVSVPRAREPGSRFLEAREPPPPAAMALVTWIGGLPAHLDDLFALGAHQLLPAASAGPYRDWVVTLMILCGDAPR